MFQPGETKMNKIIWDTIEIIAQKQNLSVSGLARRAGLNPTTFNRSKRKSAAGQERWPSTYSIHRVLTASNLTWQDFSNYVNQNYQKTN